jgi:uncharacterized small protein (DUF1192 family)
MDWDEIKAPTGKRWSIGDDLAALSINELEERVGTLEGEIARVKAVIAAKRQQALAADAFFKT